MGFSAGTISAIKLGVAVVGAAGALSSAASASSQAKFQQALAHQRAGREREIAELDATAKRKEGAALAGKQRALLAGSGVETGTGTALLLETDLAAETEYQALLIKAGGLTQAAQSESEAALFGQKARSSLTAGRFRAGSTLLSAGGKFAK